MRKGIAGPVPVRSCEALAVVDKVDQWRMGLAPTAGQWEPDVNQPTAATRELGAPVLSSVGGAIMLIWDAA